MPSSFESGALLGHIYTFADGSSLRLRLARSADFAAIRGLLAEAGSDVAAGRLVHFDPRRRYVVCATGLIGSSESLLGVGSIELGATKPDLLVVAETAHEDVGRRLEAVLVAAAAASARAA